MEENKDDIIYDLCNAEGAEEQRALSYEGSESSEENAERAEEQGAQSSAGSEESEHSEGFEQSENSEGSESLEESESSEENAESAEEQRAQSSDNSNPHEAELQRMVEEMGAETVLSIIRDNRNAAIRQIISEVEAGRARDMPTGASASAPCSSIFDLAALA